MFPEAWSKIAGGIPTLESDARAKRIAEIFYNLGASDMYVEAKRIMREVFSQCTSTDSSQPSSSAAPSSTTSGEATT